MIKDWNDCCAIFGKPVKKYQIKVEVNGEKRVMLVSEEFFKKMQKLLKNG
jgi:hypothetical protein